MVRGLRHSLWFVAIIVCCVPAVIEAQNLGYGPGQFLDCCVSCYQPQQYCSCTTFRPVVRTQYRREDITCYRDVVKTAYQRQQCIENVPVTTMRSVSETVWVPKTITRQVPQTVLQPRVRQVTVPYQFTQRVPYRSSRMVPYNTVEYVPQTTGHWVTPQAAADCPTCATPGLAPGHNHNPMPAAPQFPQQQGYPTPAEENPVPTYDDAAKNLPAIPSMPSIDLPDSVIPNRSPAPGGLQEDGNSGTAGPSAGSQLPALPTGLQQRTGGYDFSRPDRAPTENRIRPGLFVPAPSAASVWRAKQ